MKSVRKLRKILGLSALYQSKRTAGTEARWSMIQASLGPQDRSLLDVGCNLGVLSRKAAHAGLVVLGVDAMPKAVLSARRAHRQVPGLAFMQLDINPDTVRRLPRCDVVLCLSVHHYWVASYGQDQAWQMIQQLVANSEKFFFEPASRRKKYGVHRPDFVDLDQNSLRTHHLERLREVASSQQKVDCLGATDCIGPEPFRLMFRVSSK